MYYMCNQSFNHLYFLCKMTSIQIIHDTLKVQNMYYMYGTIIMTIPLPPLPPLLLDS